MSAIPIIFLLAPLAIYVIVAFRKGARPVTEDEFFESRGMISADEFANSSVAYGFQIASVSVFFGFGYHYGLGGIVNPVFWGFGIVLFLLVINRLGDFFGTTQTLHGFLGSRYRSRSITIVASIMTIIGFLGAFTAELAWGSQVLKIISNDTRFILFSMVVMASIVAWYVTRSGHLSVIKTDQYQVVFAHVAFVILVVFLITLLHWGSPQAKAVGLFLSIISALILFAVSFFVIRQIHNRLEAEPTEIGRKVSYTVLVIIGLGGITCVGNAIIFSGSFYALDLIATDQRLYTFNQGPINLLSLALLPLCWQFADVTMWQRLGATRLPPPSDPNRYDAIKRALLRYAIESPASWLLALIAGVALRYSNIGIDDASVWNGIAEIPVAIVSADTQAGLLTQYVVAGIFIAGIVAAMLSTADSFLIGSTFTLVHDLTPALAPENKIVSGKGGRLRLGRLSAVVFIIVGLTSYLISTYFKFDILTLLFGAFGAQVSLFPAVFGTIVLRRYVASGGWALASIVVGFIGATTATIFALSNSAWALYPPLFALISSSSVYLIGIGVAVGGRIHNE